MNDTPNPLRRVFIALPVTGDVANLAAHCQHQLNPLDGWRSAPLQQLHLTLFFFAALSNEQVETITDSMLSIGRCFAPFELEFGPIGSFGFRARSSAVWLGCNSSRALHTLHRSMADRLRQCGLSFDRRIFRPHVTLGRMRAHPDRLTELRLKPQVARQTVDRLILYESQLMPSGAKHRAIACTPLSGAAQSPL